LLFWRFFFKLKFKKKEKKAIEWVAASKNFPMLAKFGASKKNAGTNRVVGVNK
jgi:hypothetical protein